MFRCSGGARYQFMLVPAWLLLLASLNCQSPYQGNITGLVTDTSGAGVAAAHITVSSGESPGRSSEESGSDGSFGFSNLPSGTYTLEVSAPGFAAYRNGAVAVAVGRTTRVEVRLTPASDTQQVRVNAQPEVMDRSESSPVTNIDRDRIEELPIPSRNYLNFALLSPSLSSSNPEYQRQSAGESAGGFSAGGLRPGSNALYIDAAEDNDEYTGLSRTELSPEAISDSQVVNHGYQARAGGSAGGAVEVETRAGSNQQHGDAFLFIQNGALNGTPALEPVPHKPDESRLRAGLSTGGEWKRSAVFYYLAGEQEMARGEEASDFTPEIAAQINAALAQVGPLRGFHVRQGFFPTTDEETELSGRADRAFGRNGFMVRYAMTNHRAVNDVFHRYEQADLSARGSAFYLDNSINGAWTSTVSPHVYN